MMITKLALVGLAAAAVAWAPAAHADADQFLTCFTHNSGTLYPTPADAEQWVATGRQANADMRGGVSPMQEALTLQYQGVQAAQALVFCAGTYDP